MSIFISYLSDWRDCIVLENFEKLHNGLVMSQELLLLELEGYWIFKGLSSS